MQRLADIAANVTWKHYIALVSLPPIELGYGEEEGRKRNRIDERRGGLSRYLARNLHHDVVLSALQEAEYVNYGYGVRLATPTCLRNESTVSRLCEYLVCAPFTRILILRLTNILRARDEHELDGALAC